MYSRLTTLTLGAASPAAPGQSISTSLRGEMLARAERLTVDATIVAGAGGALSVYVQRRVAVNRWADMIAFPSVAAGVTANYTISIDGRFNPSAPMPLVGVGTDVAATPALAAGTAVNCNPGTELRIVCVAGAGTSGAGSVSLTVSPYAQRT